MIQVLILEDNPKVLEVINEGLAELEKDLGKIEKLQFSEGKKSQEFSRRNSLEKFDVILLDYVSADEINFNQAVLDQADPKKIIAISNTKYYNLKAKEKEVSRIVQKNYSDLIGFKNKLKEEIKSILNFKIT